MFAVIVSGSGWCYTACTCVLLLVHAAFETEHVFGQVTLCEQLEAYMGRFATDNGNAAAAAGNGEVKQLAVPSGMREMASKKKDELDDKYGGTGGKKVLYLGAWCNCRHISY